MSEREPMHPATRLSVLIAATVVLVGLALPADAAPDTRTEAVTIRLISVTTELRVQKDVAPKEVFSPGDVIWQKSVLRNAAAQFGKPKGARVGSDTGTVTIVSRTLVDNKGVSVLPGGTIRIAGRTKATGTTLTLPVTGGTGRYAGARGKLDVRSLDASGTRASNVYRLTLP